MKTDFQRLRSNLCRRHCACVCVLRMQQCSPQVRPIRTFGMRAISAISPISQLQPRAAPMRRLAGHRKAVGKVGCWERAPLLPAQHREGSSLCWAERPAAKAFGPTFPQTLRCAATVTTDQHDSSQLIVRRLYLVGGHERRGRLSEITARSERMRGTTA